MFNLKTFSAIVLTAVAVAIPVEGSRTFKVINKCPKPINLFVNGRTQGSLRPNGGSTSLTYSNSFSGVFYTDANGGNRNGFGTTRAGFEGVGDYYYEVVDANNFNTEISIAPNRAQFNGQFCQTISCGSIGCKTAYTNSPSYFPPPSPFAPNPPLYTCPAGPGSNGYTVTFCPNGNFPVPPVPPKPPVKTTAVRTKVNSSKCIDVRGGQYANGTPVQIYDCNGTGAQNWSFANGKVQLVGNNFCLDAGTNPANGVGLKIWTCYPGLAAQAWTYTSYQRIALNSGGQCVDLTGGSTSNGNQLQTYHCTSGNINQVWTTGLL
ncbi:hypothetical protein H0H81_002054 [Sphagnurus paluster]|uniref:Ricin B lectin domain-containing protein n=1 Tax=Sphagnurus paluster TaxID=117069 RepID=A0A9P7FS85_9AGAR|nr:hypothetical protein H0H81_002054 [Sphagnurus paluster]